MFPKCLWSSWVLFLIWVLGSWKGEVTPAKMDWVWYPLVLQSVQNRVLNKHKILPMSVSDSVSHCLLFAVSFCFDCFFVGGRGGLVWFFSRFLGLLLHNIHFSLLDRLFHMLLCVQPHWSVHVSENTQNTPFCKYSQICDLCDFWSICNCWDKWSYPSRSICEHNFYFKVWVSLCRLTLSFAYLTWHDL